MVDPRLFTDNDNRYGLAELPAWQTNDGKLLAEVLGAGG